MRCKAALATALVCAALGPVVAMAQTSAPPDVQWRLEVVRDGALVDTFDGTTAVGQAVTATHHHEAVHDVGCKNAPEARIDLARTLTVSPVSAQPNGVTLAIDAQETIEDDTAQRTPEGCALPPEPRRITATHPGLLVPPGRWTNWTIVERRPALVYRVWAKVVAHRQD